MSKKVLYVGDGKWCYTEGCVVHTANARSINPRSEKASVLLKQRSVATLNALPTKKELAEQGDMDKVAQYKQALLHYEDACLHLAISPRGRKSLLEKVSGNSVAQANKEKLISFYEDSTKLLDAYSRVKSRYFYGSVYSAPDGTQIRAIPLSLDNISEVNEWVDSFYKIDPAWSSTSSDDKAEDSEVSSDQPSDQPALDKKTKTKIFRKKNKLWYRNHTGSDSEMKTGSYLIRENNKDGFTLVAANKFESDYKSLSEKKVEPLNLNRIERERFFPSQKLSDFIVIEG